MKLRFPRTKKYKAVGMRERERGQNGMGELPKAGGQKGFVAQAKDKKKKKESEKTWDANFSKYLNKYIEKVLNGTKK